MNYRGAFGAIAIVTALFPLPVQAQTSPVATDKETALLAPDKRDSDSGSLAPDPFPSNLSSKVTAPKAVPFHKAQFLALSSGVYVAAAADMYQTLKMRHYSWWSETDPLARPFVKLPAPAYYTTGFALATGVNWLSLKMGRSRRWHKLAPLPQLFSIVGNAYGFKSNHFQGH